MSLGDRTAHDYTNQNAKEADMCEFCTQHGEGEKWYLTMENYSYDLLDQHERRQYAAEFLNGFDKRVPKSIKQLDMIRRTPLMKLAKPILTHHQKQDHYGQVPLYRVCELIPALLLWSEFRG